MRYEYCGGDFKLRIDKFTGLVHPPLALAMCSLGSVSNVLCVVVLTRPRMASPTSIILVGLALSDILVLLAYVPFAAIQAAIGDKVEYGLSGTSKSYSLSAYSLFNSIFNKVIHAVSIWLTVTLAVWRYLVVCWPNRCKEWCSQTRAKWTVVSVYVSVTIMHTPFYYVYHVEHRGSYYENDIVRSLYSGVTLEFGVTIIAALCITAIFVKLIPCLLLTFLTLRLVWALVQGKRSRRDILGNIRPIMGTTTEVDRKMERTTRMVVVVLFVFLVTECPEGILLLLSAIYGDGFYIDCYYYVTRILDVIVLLNSAINFVLYCTMSKEFRDTFIELFVPKGGTSWIRTRLTLAQDVNAIGRTDSPSVVTISCSPCGNGIRGEHRRGSCSSYPKIPQHHCPSPNYPHS